MKDTKVWGPATPNFEHGLSSSGRGGRGCRNRKDNGSEDYKKEGPPT